MTSHLRRGRRRKGSVYRTYVAALAEGAAFVALIYGAELLHRPL